MRARSVIAALLAALILAPAAEAADPLRRHTTAMLWITKHKGAYPSQAAMLRAYSTHHRAFYAKLDRMRLLKPFQCIQSKETPPPFPSWRTNTGNGFYGGLQMELRFQREYGPEYLRRFGTANRWPAWAQFHAAVRGYRARGFQPWPLTRRYCGLPIRL